MPGIARLTDIYPTENAQGRPWGLHADRLVVGMGLGASPAGDGSMPGLESQAREVFRMMRELIEGAGGRLGNIAKATAYVTRESDREPPGVPARDPTVAIGGMVITSRVHPTVPFADGDIAEGGLAAQARQAFENVLALLSRAGGEPRDIQQLISFGRTQDYAATVVEVFEELFPDEASRPHLATITNFVPAKFEVMVEMVARTGDRT